MAKEKKFSLMPAKEKAEHIYTWLLENKAKDIKVLDVKSAITDIVIIFQEDTRELFQLERLWHEAENIVLSERAKKA